MRLAHLSMSYTGASTFTQGRKARLSAYLFVPGSGFVQGRRVVMMLGSAPSAQRCTTKPSNSKGHVSCAIAKVKQPVGRNLLTITFAGDKPGPSYDYVAAQVGTLVTVKRK